MSEPLCYVVMRNGHIMPPGIHMHLANAEATAVKEEGEVVPLCPCASPVMKAETQESLGPRVLPCKQCGAEYDGDPCLFPKDCHVQRAMTSAPAALAQQKEAVPIGYAHVFLRSIGQEQIPYTIVSAPSALPSAANAEAEAKEIVAAIDNVLPMRDDLKSDAIYDIAAIIRKHMQHPPGWVPALEKLRSWNERYPAGHEMSFGPAKQAERELDSILAELFPKAAAPQAAEEK